MLVLALIPLAGAQEPKADKADKAERALGILRQIDEGFVQLFEKVAPTVVVIEAIKPVDDEEGEEMKGFEFFFNRDKDGKGEGEKDGGTGPWKLPAQPSRSEGSGFLIRPDGFILTNYHVVEDAEKLTVRLKDGRKFLAKVVGVDDKTDIAVLKIDAKALPIVDLADSERVRVGQLVFAIGTPYNQDFSFTAGWVSGKGRTNLIGPSSPHILYEDYIQTDAFINPGNSGGPLFDVEGRVVGMNTLINGIGRGLAFAIPANMLQTVSSQLIATGKVQRPWLGIRIQTLSENATLRQHLTGIEHGVVVDTIEASAPAFRSELRPADVIVEIDGVKVVAARDLQREILKKKIGQSVPLTVWRSGAPLKIAVITGELPNEPNKSAARPPRSAVGGAVAGKAESYGLALKDAKPKGAFVGEIATGSVAARAEIQPGDIITDVEAHPVADAAGCASAIGDAVRAKSGRGILLSIERNGKRTFALLQP